MGHLDDLPRRPPEHVGETESCNTFRTLFKDPFFLIRREEANDYGVDLEVEVLIPSPDGGSFPTNFRIHVQLKSSIKEPKKDDSYSYSVDRSNLNYLLDSPRSIYVFYSRENNELFYRWAEDVFVEYEKKGTVWQSQNTITINFKDLLNQETTITIHDRLVKEGKMERDIRLKMRFNGIHLGSVLEDDLSQYTSTNVSDIIDLLSNHGFVLAAEGQANEVLGLFALIPEGSLNDSVKLVKAYSCYLLSQPSTAFDVLRKCNPKTLKSDEEKALFTMLDLSVNKTMGMIDFNTYANNIEQIVNQYPNTNMSMYAKLEKLRIKGITSRDAAIIEEIMLFIAELKSHGESMETLAMQAEIVCLELRFYKIQNEYIKQVFEYHVTRKLAIDSLYVEKRSQAAIKIVEEMKHLLEDFEANMRYLEDKKQHLIFADGLYTFANCIVQNIAIFDKTTPPSKHATVGRTKQLERTIQRLIIASDIYRKASTTEKQATALLLIAAALRLLNRNEEMIKLVEEIVTLAKSEGLIEVYQRAINIINGASPLLGEFNNIPNIYDI